MSESLGWAIRLRAEEVRASGSLRLRAGIEACLSETGEPVFVSNSSGSLSPVLRGEGGGEGLDDKLRGSRISSFDPSPQPSPLSTGEREPDAAAASEGHTQPQMVWLRGTQLPEDLDHALRKLASDGFFAVAADGTFSRQGSRLPMGRLPETGWLPLDQWLAPAPQPPSPLARLTARVALRLERDADERPATVLLTALEPWAAYARTAPAVRLSVLAMAASADGRLIVRGAPLPPINGTRYAEASGIAVPCGFQIRPALDPAVLVRLLGLGNGDVALFRTDGSYERIEAHCFTRATRAGVRKMLMERRP